MNNLGDNKILDNIDSDTTNKIRSPEDQVSNSNMFNNTINLVFDNPIISPILLLVFLIAIPYISHDYSIILEMFRLPYIKNGIILLFVTYILRPKSFVYFILNAFITFIALNIIETLSINFESNDISDSNIINIYSDNEY